MKHTSPYGLAAFLIGSLLVLSACGWFDGPDAGSVLDPSEGTSPANDFELLVATAIDRAVLSEKDIPDYGLIKNKNRIVVSRRSSEGRQITAGALPESESVDFVLATPEQIQEIANEDGDFLFLAIGEISIDGPEATISISTRWAVAESSDVIYLSGGGYQLQYQKRHGEWAFVDILMMWIS